jgi:hypothetical protein
VISIISEFIKIEIGIEKRCNGNKFDPDFDSDFDPDGIVLGTPEVLVNDIA